MDYFINFVFGVYPYLAGTVFLIACWIRFDTEQYTWKSDSSQLLSRANMRLASNFFHIGIIGIFLGHFVGLLGPHALWSALGISDLGHQYLAMYAGGAFGALCLIGGAMLWARRMFNPRVRAASRWMDIALLSWILITLLVGLSTIFVSAGHASEGNVDVMLALSAWAKSIVAFNPQPQIMATVDPIYRLHVFLGMSLFLFFPFTRLVHIWSVPIGYLGRAYQIVRTKRRQHAGT
ncbi:MAG: respiratory nitrate reductase subunit gamma [Gammaproteobacteria bacterium]